MGESTSPDVREHVAGLVAELGVKRAAATLGISSETAAKIIGGLPVRAGSEALVREHRRRRMGERA